MTQRVDDPVVTVPVPGTGTRTSTPADVDGAVDRARRAFTQWSALSARDRARLMLDVRRRILARVDDVVDTIVAETGKLSVEAVVSEVFVACEEITYYAKHAPGFLAPERVRPGIFAHKRAEKRFEPLGVVGVISPWNYPFVLSTGPVMGALFAGNAVVLKPSEFTPGVGVLIGDLVAEAGLPRGVVEVVTGDGTVGEALVRSPVAKICFTGSVRTGRAVARAAADNLTPVLLELGGKDPLIVCRDADLDRAARAAVWGGFSNCGQTCIATERVYVVEDVYDSFVDKVVNLTAAVRQGSGPGHDVGAMTHAGQTQIVMDHLADAVERGATVATGGTSVLVGGRPSVTPTVLVDVDHSMAVMRDETFGPVLPVMKVRDEDEALALANDSPFGLSASVFGKDPTTIERLVAGLRTGSVCVNDVMVSFAMPGLPFGGARDSGSGLAHGPEGLREFTRVKSVARDRAGLRREPMWFPVPRSLERLARGAMRLRYGLGRHAR